MQRLKMRFKRSVAVNVILFLINVIVFVGLCTYAFDRDEDVFRRGVMLLSDRRVFIDMTKAFFDATEAAGVKCFINYGTMLGSYRNHDLIPWDDDMDIMCNNSQRVQLKKVMQSLAPKYGMHQYQADDLWKFFAADPAISRGYIHRGNYRWPFIDIMFFKENATHVWNQNAWMRPLFLVPRRYVFPLSRRPLASLRVPAPCDTGLVVQSMFSDISQCVSREHSHRVEVAFVRYMIRTVPCADLAGSFPFVDHQVMAGGSVNETLRLGDVALYSMVMPPCVGTAKSTQKAVKRN